MNKQRVPEEERSQQLRYYWANRSTRLEYYQKKREENRAWLDSLKERPCDDCGGEFHPRVMEFHHLRDKKFLVSNVTMRARKKVLAEIEKCVLLCVNCHRMRHIANV